MRIKCIAVGKTREAFIQIGEEIYRKRLQRYIDLQWIVIKEEKIYDSLNERKLLALEADRIKAQLGSSEWIVALSHRGSPMSSEQFAQLFSQKMDSGVKCISFIVGGPLGISEELLRIANQKLSLSPMTFTHEMTRLILLEQTYRAFTILNGEKYHK